jgi:5-methylcytosine-specific restriction endonuclease McrA
MKEKDMESAIQNLSSKQLIFCFLQNNQQYAWIIKFRVYQRIDKPQKPINPAPSIQNTKYRTAIFKRDNYLCHICGEITEISTNSNDSNFPTVDHIIPQSKGGNHYPSNLKTACSRCNKRRGNTDLDQFQDDSTNVPRTFIDETETETKTLGVYSNDFLSFWSEYPKAVKKKMAFKEWEKNKTRPDIEIILKAIREQKKNKTELKCAGQFCPEWPDPERWIKNERWNDELLEIKQGCNGNKSDKTEVWEK